MKDKAPNQYRYREGVMGSDNSYGMNGVFIVPKEYNSGSSVILQCIVSDGEGWEHVSVTIPNSKRCPNWEEMCFIKDIFWREDETVIQFHPKKSEYVNMHPNCLHLWKKVGVDYETPPSLMVGLKSN